MPRDKLAPPEYEHQHPILLVGNVHLTLGGNVILRDVNLEVKGIHRPGKITGRVIGLLGPSGIGKTRLFRIIAGLDRPDAGTVRVGAQCVPVQAGMIGFVAQSYPLFQHRTVLGNLLAAGRALGLDSVETMARAQAFLRRFNLESHAGHYPSELSGGQRQRIAIAQQFMRDEHFVLLDEPFSGLDIIAADHVCELITEVAGAQPQNTVIVATHDISAALKVSDTIWLLGRDRDVQGNFISGARVQLTYDLIERGLAWQPGISDMPEFARTLREICGQFQTL